MRYAPILLALTLAATARADAGRTLHLTVHGSIDGAVLGAALGRELGLEVAVVDGVCEVPCLAVAIDGNATATITFAPRSGQPRARAVHLGNDVAQWPLVITLLAGNVVRDEAQDVLAGLPARDLPRPAPPEVGPAPPPSPSELTAGAALAAGEAPDAADPAAGGEPAERPDAAAPAGARAAAQPASVAAAPAPEPDAAREHRFLGLGLVPGLSTDLTRIGSVRHFLSIDLLVGVSGGSSGLAFAGVADIQRGMVAGLQTAGVVAIARRVAGIQVAGVAAVAGALDGVQVAGATAVADRVDGVQVAGVVALSRSAADYQLAGVAAAARGNAELQLGGVAAVARDATLQLGGVAAVAHDANLQVAGVASVARGTANFQVAGLVNVAQRVLGIQLAPINVARAVDGIQIGVINVGGSSDGFSFGLINIVPGGRYDLETAIDSNRIGTVLFRHGGRRWHNVYGIGGHPVNETGPNDDVWMYGLGFGPSLELGRTVVDLELMGWQVNHGPRHTSDVSVLGQLRLSVARRIGPVALVAGGIVNTYVTNDQESPLFLERSTAPARMDDHVTVTTWPSVFVGIRI
jgi:hypothetical protein